MITVPWPLNKLIDRLLQKTNKATAICASLGIFLLLSSRTWTAWIPNSFLEPKIQTIILQLTTAIIILIVIIAFNTTPQKDKKQTNNPKNKNDFSQYVMSNIS
jgi:hypothetical protein